MKNNFLKKYISIFIIFIYSILIISCGKDFASSDIVEGTVVLSDTDVDMSENAMATAMTGSDEQRASYLARTMIEFSVGAFQNCYDLA